MFTIIVTRYLADVHFESMDTYHNGIGVAWVASVQALLGTLEGKGRDVTYASRCSQKYDVVIQLMGIKLFAYLRILYFL